MSSRTAGWNLLIDTAFPWFFRHRAESAPRPRVAPDIARSRGAVAERTSRPSGACSDPRQLSVALASSQTRLDAALHAIQALERNNHRLKRQALRFARLAAHARHYAYHDGLTDLPNRRMLGDRFRQIKAQAQRHDWQIGFMMLDLNHFKCVNDRFGHAAGDDLLRHVATCLLGCTRRSDTVCRLGGDEFVIMLPEIQGREHMAVLAAKIHARLAQRYVVEGACIDVATSIGIAIYPADGEELDILLKQADIRMYRAKNAR